MSAEKSGNSICSSENKPGEKEVKKKILCDLGKATKRGVRRCFKCGVYNGTRGFTCKNKDCDAVFKDVEKRKVNLDAVKLAGTNKLVYSIKVKDKGPDFRGFVQLPLACLNKKDGEEKLNLGNGMMHNNNNSVM